jgi:hypothetical protein
MEARGLKCGGSRAVPARSRPTIVCVAAAAYKMAPGRRRGREELGDPRGGKGSWAARSCVCSPRCPRGPGRALRPEEPPATTAPG